MKKPCCMINNGGGFSAQAARVFPPQANRRMPNTKAGRDGMSEAKTVPGPRTQRPEQPLADSAPPTPNLLEMRGISKRFPGVLALNQVDFSVRRGEIHALIGENGAGKSTLIKILAGAYQADAGDMWLDGRPVLQHSPAAMQRLGISVIYQELNLVPYLSVGRNIFMGHEPKIAPGVIDFKAMHQRSRELLALLGVTLPTDQPVADLGIAARQLVEVAKALSYRVRLLIMDEPTAPLSEQEIATLFEVVRRLREQGVTVIYISHRLEEVFKLADRVTVLRDGQVVGTHAVQDVSKDDLVRMMVGRDIKDQFPKAQVEPGEVVLRVSGLPGPAGNTAELTVRAGEIVALAGLMGSGRSELVRQIFGADPLHQGRIEVKGRAVPIRSTRQAIRAGIGMVPEDRKTQGLVLERPVSDNISLPVLGELSFASVVRRGAVAALVGRLMRALDIRAQDMGQVVRTLSGGNQQKVVLAKWLASESQVLILDEPTRGVDVGARAEIYGVIGELVQQGKAILLISSDLPEVLGLCDRVIVVYGGRLVAEFDRRDAVPETIIQYASGAFEPSQP